MADPIHLMTAGRTPRTWSVLVTIFGDMAREEGERLSGAQLADLTDPLGIRPEALRTALHRLRRDGWIESTRHGRQTTHALTPDGRAQSQAAVPRIYAPSRPTDLFLVVVRPGDALPERSYPVASNLALASSKDGFALPLDTPPRWMQDAICPAALLAETNWLADRLKSLTAYADPDLTPSLRTIVVHDWRRIALRTPALPTRAFPPDWRGAEAERLLGDLLPRLPRLDHSTNSTSTP